MRKIFRDAIAFDQNIVFGKNYILMSKSILEHIMFLFIQKEKNNLKDVGDQDKRRLIPKKKNLNKKF